MNCKGQIGQAITSFPVLIFVFVIMFIFFIISGFISAVGLGTESSTAIQEVERINSRVLLEMFLGDYVLIDGKKEKIEDIISKMTSSGLTIKGELAELIMNRFKEKYGCGNDNEFLIFLDRYGVPDFSEAPYETVNYDLPINYPSFSYVDLTDGFSKKDLGRKWYIATKGNIKC